MPRPIEMTLETITPTSAEKYLATMKQNRRLRMRHLDMLTQEIINGHWQVNGETIKFNHHGHLIDGQHRLWAVIKANTSIDTYVVRELPETSTDTIDLGLKRTPGDILGFQGYADSSNLAAAARWLWRYETKQMEGYRTNPSIETLRVTIDAHAQLKDSLAYGQLTWRYITRSLGSALHCLMSESSSTTANLLFTALQEGEGLLRGMPVYILRQRLITNSQAKAKLPDYEVAAIVIKAFNAVKSGRKISYLRWGSVGGQGGREEFPTIQ